MKVFNLRCDQEHVFEGWFGRGEDFDAQVASGLIQCPVCGSGDVHKMLSAPRINLGRAAEAEPAAVPAAVPAAPSSGPAAGSAAPGHAQLQRLWLQAARRLVESTEDVGDRFAEEARRIHYRETPERGIRGQTTPQQAAELADEGIEVFAFPLPAALKNPIQ